jgi:hypothetical protein
LEEAVEPAGVTTVIGTVARPSLSGETAVIWEDESTLKL